MNKYIKNKFRSTLNSLSLIIFLVRNYTETIFHLQSNHVDLLRACEVLNLYGFDCDASLSWGRVEAYSSGKLWKNLR